MPEGLREFQSTPNMYIYDPLSSSPIVDILVPTTQLVSIHQAFIQTDEWLEVDKSGMDELH
ncbi:hypothetical protein HOY82DRAFT_609975 [Tuber indicum]|nr:hypothetical protein HOY82DRAFT_609975 [Tuber indicum]